jgi:hypothetical protein
MEKEKWLRIPFLRKSKQGKSQLPDFYKPKSVTRNNFRLITFCFYRLCRHMSVFYCLILISSKEKGFVVKSLKFKWSRFRIRKAAFPQSKNSKIISTALAKPKPIAILASKKSKNLSTNPSA